MDKDKLNLNSTTNILLFEILQELKKMNEKLDAGVPSLGTLGYYGIPHSQKLVPPGELSHEHIINIPDHSQVYENTIHPANLEYFTTEQLREIAKGGKAKLPKGWNLWSNDKLIEFIRGNE